MDVLVDFFIVSVALYRSLNTWFHEAQLVKPTFQQQHNTVCGRMLVFFLNISVKKPKTQLNE